VFELFRQADSLGRLCTAHGLCELRDESQGKDELKLSEAAVVGGAG